MASREPIPDDPRRPAPVRRVPPAADGGPDRTLPRLEFRPPPSTVKDERDVGYWIAILCIIGLIIAGVLILSGVIHFG